MPLDISLEIQAGSKVFEEYGGATPGTLSTDYRISNPTILCDLHSVSVDLTNAFTQHNNAGNTLDYFIQSTDVVEHSVPTSSLWSINQARAMPDARMLRYYAAATTGTAGWDSMEQELRDEVQQHHATRLEQGRA